jgi:hypothetical protein
LIEAFRAGKSVDEAIGSYAGNGIFETTPDPFAASLGQLREREKDTDVPISDFIEANAKSRRYFYTPNHPTNELLGEMLRRLVNAAGLDADIAAGVAIPYRLDEIYIAASQGVVSRYNLDFDTEARYRGRDVIGVDGTNVQLGGVREYSLRELTEAFFHLYEPVFAKT